MRSDVLKKLAVLISFLLVFLAGSSLIFTLHLLLEDELSKALRQITSQLFWVLLLGGILSTGVLTFFFHWLIDRFAAPVEQLSDQVSIQFLNPDAHPLSIGKGDVFSKLNASINTAASELHQQRTAMQHELNRLSARLISERDTLAAVIEQLQQGVVITNQEGSILLYNSASSTLLSFPDQDPPVYLGLGRSMHSMFKSALVNFALDESKNRPASDPVHFLADTPDGRFLKVKVLPASLTGLTDTGFIFFIEDVSAQLKGKNQQQLHAEESIRLLRDATAGVRMTTENLLDYPLTPEPQRQQFLEIIAQEAEKLEKNVTNLQLYFETDAKDSGLSIIPAHSFLELLSRLALRYEIEIQIKKSEENPAFLADAYSLPLSIFFLLSKLNYSGHPQISFKVNQGYVILSLRMMSSDTSHGLIEALISDPPVIQGIALPYPVSDVFNRHNATWWLDEALESEFCELQIMFPADKEIHIEKPTHPEKVTAFDFDLFRVKVSDELSAMKLRNLTATVFDTETTGLYPSDGDRLLSIGAVRVVNGKIQQQSFHELIDPERSIPKASTEIHGITNEMIVGKPKVKKVLRDFHLFCDGTLLIAHNAAFDMRFLELEQKRAGVVFSQPILDTLLLSTVLHPHLEGHSLDVLMPRYGIETGKRHDALGDAMMTALLFQKMIPLLEQAGIITLEDAISAAKNSLYAKLKY